MSNWLERGKKNKEANKKNLDREEKKRMEKANSHFEFLCSTGFVPYKIK